MSKNDGAELATLAHEISGPARILGIPVKDGAYWYYQLGKLVPSVVQVCTYKGNRAVRNSDGGFQSWWLDGEFFVGPIEPPFASPDALANPSEDTFRTAHENMRRSDGQMDGGGTTAVSESMCLRRD